MKKILFSLTLLMTFSFAGQNALGIYVGEPTGLSYRYELQAESSLHLVAAWSFNNTVDRLKLQGDLDFLVPGFIDLNGFIIDGYYGPGGFLNLGDNFLLGGRFAFGLTKITESKQFEWFVEVAPGLSILPETVFDISGGIGLRYRL